MLNDIIQSLIIIFIIMYGTKLVNYYYNFYHIYNYLDYEQKLGYFKSNCVINLISKNIFLKKIIVYHFLIPIIKLNYFFISIFITMLYFLCQYEFKKILNNECRKNNRSNKIHDLMLSETSDNLVNNSLNTKNHMNVDLNNIKLEKNTITQVENIGMDYNNKICDIIEFTSSECVKELKTSLESNKKNIETLESNTKLNLLNEIDSLKINTVDNNIDDYVDVADINYIMNNNVDIINNETVIINNDVVVNNINDNENDCDDLTNYINKNNDMHIENDTALINEYNDLINLEDIDFGINIEKLTSEQLNLFNNQTKEQQDTNIAIEKKIIKIGKKRKNQ